MGIKILLLRKKLKDKIFRDFTKLYLILDVDGVLTDGGFYYSNKGKILKKFVAEDADALNLAKAYCEIIFISADLRGFRISQKRINDMGFELVFLPSQEREDYILNLKKSGKVVYMADSFTDVPALRVADFSVVPQNAKLAVRKYSDYICEYNGGHGAVAEFVLELLNYFMTRDSIK